MNSQTKPSDRQSVFDKRQTNIIKGIAILCMVLHHTVGIYYNQFDLSWYGSHCDSFGSLITVFLSTAGKVCVSLFTLLSGFGISKSYESYSLSHKGLSSDVRFAVSHLIQFYSVYWVMFVFNVVLRCTTFSSFDEIYGSGYNGVIKCAVDFFGLSKLIYGEGGCGDWFVSAILILYAVFPIIYRVGRRLRPLPVLVSALPWIFRPVLNGAGIKTDSVLFCLLAFSTGVFFAQDNTFAMLGKYIGPRYKLISVAVVLAAFAGRLVFSLYGDYFLAIALVNLGIFVVPDCGVSGKVLGLFGKNSADIWLSHITVLSVLSYYTLLPVWWKYFAALTATLLLSIFIELIKTKAKYNSSVRRIRKYIEGR